MYDGQRLIEVSGGYEKLRDSSDYCRDDMLWVVVLYECNYHCRALAHPVFIVILIYMLAVSTTMVTTPAAIVIMLGFFQYDS